MNNAISEAVTSCALRFDGFRWIAMLPSPPVEGLASFTSNFVGTLVPFATREENFATFFALQRWLYGKGGETQEDLSSDWLAYWQLFLSLWELPTPTKYVDQDYEARWQIILPRGKAIAAAVRDHVVSDFGGSRSRYVRPWWTPLKKTQLGRFAEHLVKLEFAKLNAEIFTPDVDDRGIDFLVRIGSSDPYVVQVKSVRSYQAVYLLKSSFKTTKNVAIALVDFTSSRDPTVFLIPLETWNEPLDELMGYQTSWTDEKNDKAYWVLHVDAKSLKYLQRYYSFATHDWLRPPPAIE